MPAQCIRPIRWNWLKVWIVSFSGAMHMQQPHALWCFTLSGQNRLQELRASAGRILSRLCMATCRGKPWSLHDDRHLARPTHDMLGVIVFQEGHAQGGSVQFLGAPCAGTLSPCALVAPTLAAPRTPAEQRTQRTGARTVAAAAPARSDVRALAHHVMMV